MLVWGQSHTNHCDWLLRVNDDFIQQTSHKTPVTVALVVKTPPANAGDIRDRDSIPASGRSPRGGHGNPLQYSCLKNPMDRGDWQATVCRAAKSWTRLKRHSMHTQNPLTASILIQEPVSVALQLHVLISNLPLSLSLGVVYVSAMTPTTPNSTL